MGRRIYHHHPDATLNRATVHEHAVAILLGAAHIPVRAARGVIVRLGEPAPGQPNYSSCVHLKSSPSPSYVPRDCRQRSTRTAKTLGDQVIEIPFVRDRFWGIWHNKGTVSRAKELESRLENTEHQLRLLQKISRFMVRQMSLGASLQEVVSLVVEFMECDSCLLYLQQGQELVLCASNNPQPGTIGKVSLQFGEG